MSSFSCEDDSTNKVSFLIGWNIAHAKYPYGEFIKRNLEVIKVLDSDNTKLNKLITQVPKSCHTTERHIGVISKNVENSLV